MKTTKNSNPPEGISNTFVAQPGRKTSLVFAIAAMASLLTAWLAPNGYFKEAGENDFIRSLKAKLSAYTAQFPEDRIYLQVDKPFYEPGDDIWLSGYIRNGQTLKASAQSEIVYVELINPKGSVEKKLNLIAKNGKVSGDFNLAEELPGGLYKIKAYTNWMKNTKTEEGEEEPFFVKDIQVQEVILPHLKMKLDFERKAFGAGDEVVAKLELNTNENRALSNYKIKCVAALNGAKFIEQAEVTDEEGVAYIKFKLPAKLNSADGLLNVMMDYNGSMESISRSIPIVLNKIKLQLFPEGGDLVSGFDNRVAFAATNEFNKPADIEGCVVTQKGSKVATFSSFHQGMGAFQFNPQKGEKYFVQITKPAGIEETTAIPEPFERGYLLHLDNLQVGEIAVNVQSSETEELSVVAQIRGKMYYSTVLNAVAGSNKFNISTANMPAGVCQVTLFDAKGIARAERLVFANRDKQMNLSIETDKEKYLPREKVKMTITVKDERGMPMPANLSMAVVNDQLLSFADDKGGNILSELLLQQDLMQKVEEPAFYFNKKESKSARALDYLLMTAGWRRFTWEKLLNDEQPAILYPAQKALITGYVMDGYQNITKAGVVVKSPDGKEYVTAADGKFSIPKLSLYAPVTLTFSADGYYSVTQLFNAYEQNNAVVIYDTKTRALEEVQVVSGESDRWMAEDFKMAPVSEKDNAGNVKKVNARKEMKAAKAAPVPVAAEPQLVNAMVMVDDAAKFDKKAKVEDLVEMANLANNKQPINWQKGKQLKAVRPETQSYYRARVFAAPNYSQAEIVETRSDFRNTIYWNPDIEIGYSGRKTIEFYTSDDVTSFRATLEGIAADGAVGRAEKNIFTQLPFALSTKLPLEVATEDRVSIPVTLKNNTSAPLGGVLAVQSPDGLKAINSLPTSITIMPGVAKTIYLDYEVLDKPGQGAFSVSFKSCGLDDAFTQTLKMVPKGFPVMVSLSGQEEQKEFSFDISNMVKGSLRATFSAYPNVVNDLMTGVEGILQEPCGCFEQTSCTAYPNAMVLDYLKNTGSKDSKTLARANSLLDRGYKRLTTFEASNKGYEWFGANPGHEGLTAYGLMEFMDMKRAGQDVDAEMMDRTARWLLNHRDGKGGFARETHAYHDFGRISNEVLNAYIVYALSDAGFTDIKKEFEVSYKTALGSKDPYMLAMLANAAFAMKETAKGNEALKLLLETQLKDGSFNGSTHSITYSQGQSLCIETTALGILALLKAESKNQGAIAAAVKYLTGTRSGSGVFSSTQGTILALKSLTEYAKYSKKANEDGTIVIYVDDRKVAEKSYKAGEKDAISILGIEEFIKGEGKHVVKVKYVGVKNPLPYSLAVKWNTSLPPSSKDCKIGLSMSLAAKTCSVGETLRLTANVSNVSKEEVPSTMVILGIPAGLSAQAWQLKELQEKRVFDYYEIKGNSIAIYYRGMGAGDVRQINLDLKAEMPGTFDAPASSAYLYYTNEYKTWCAVPSVTIKKVN